MLLNKNVLKNNLGLIIIILFALSLTAIILLKNTNEAFLGHSYRDVYLYLISALKLSGMKIVGYDYVDYLSPLIPFLTSILFNLGFISKTSIYLTTGIFYFLGIIGIYLILKLKFKDLIAIFGTILYSMLAINILWAANGTLDIPSISLAIWALYIFILGIEKNQKFLYLTFPLIVLTFFGKYTGALVVPLMALYFLSKKDILGNIKKYFKNLVIGLFFGILTLIPFLAYFILNDIPFGFLNQAGEVASKTSTTATSGGKLIGNDLFFYIKGLVYDISSTEYIYGAIILISIVIGLILLVYKFLNILKENYGDLKVYLALILSFILIIISFLTASLFSFIYSEIILFLGLLLLSKSLEKISPNSFPYLSLNITMIGFFMVYLVFFTSHLTKADRYFTAMAPGFIYIATLAIDYITHSYKKIDKILPIALIIILLISGGVFLSKDKTDSLVNYEENAATWIMKESPDYKNLTIYADRGPIFTWYLKHSVFYVKDSYTSDELNDKMIEDNATYYIRLGDEMNFTDYKKVKNFKDVIVYKRI
ncbi:glycosyltransferase family 39 protein [Methanobrevibacter sp. DSM 116169]|uniref:glycosyltransferase family 39 protein n=1 Tax=Methanobrevibacter sp. DSM 116169 TaxID=3242727 RepID=UPI0038FCEF3B